MPVLSCTSDDTVELVEIGYCGDGNEEVFLDGVQLTYRFLDEVVAPYSYFQSTPELTDTD